VHAQEPTARHSVQQLSGLPGPALVGKGSLNGEWGKGHEIKNSINYNGFQWEKGKGKEERINK
jgi:hypothetical protein